MYISLGHIINGVVLIALIIIGHIKGLQFECPVTSGTKD